jgi:hypothetical protein
MSSAKLCAPGKPKTGFQSRHKTYNMATATKPKPYKVVKIPATGAGHPNDSDYFFKPAPLEAAIRDFLKANPDIDDVSISTYACQVDGQGLRQAAFITYREH